jgi:hypothetical protein
LGATDYFTKPLNFEELKKLMLRLCSGVLLQKDRASN